MRGAGRLVREVVADARVNVCTNIRGHVRRSGGADEIWIDRLIAAGACASEGRHVTWVAPVM